MKVILPGSYDPVTLGHIDLIRRAAKEHNPVYAVVFINPEKKCMFSIDERREMLALALGDIDGVIVDSSEGLVVDYMREHGIEAIVKGYRNEKDLEYEKIQSEYNEKHGGYKTELYESDAHLSHVSSTLARKLILEGGRLDDVLSLPVINYIKRKY